MLLAFALGVVVGVVLLFVGLFLYGGGVSGEFERENETVVAESRRQAS
jgi:hypothetical protein